MSMETSTNHLDTHNEPSDQELRTYLDNQAEKAAQEIMDRGFATMEIGNEPEMSKMLNTAWSLADEHFEQAAIEANNGNTGQEIFRYRTHDDQPATMSGTRLWELKDEYSYTDDKPDLCNTLAFMPGDGDEYEGVATRAPNWEEFTALPATQALIEVRQRFMLAGTAVMQKLAERYGVDAPSQEDFDPHSFMDIKTYPTNNGSRPFRQGPHDDGQLLTIALADQKGLELITPNYSYDDNGTPQIEDGPIHICEPSPNTVVIMPGSILTWMTGGFMYDAEGNITGVAKGAIAPQHHMVRNASPESERHFAGLFLNPDVTKWIEPWLTTSLNNGMPIGQIANDTQTEFGMAPYVPPEYVPTNGPSLFNR